MSAPVLWPVSADLALQQVGSGVRYSDHDVDVVATAVHDPEQSWTLSKHFGNAAASHPFFARTENDMGMRGWPSGSRHHPSGVGTSIGTPCHGNTSCSRNIVIISSESISAPRISDSGCIHSRVA